jgi:hypothetical protein
LTTGTCRDSGRCIALDNACLAMRRTRSHGLVSAEKRDRRSTTQLAVRVVLALGVAYMALIVVFVLAAFAITGWMAAILGVLFAVVALAWAFRAR